MSKKNISTKNKRMGRSLLGDSSMDIDLDFANDKRSFNEENLSFGEIVDDNFEIKTEPKTKEVKEKIKTKEISKDKPKNLGSQTRIHTIYISEQYISYMNCSYDGYGYTINTADFQDVAVEDKGDLSKNRDSLIMNAMNKAIKSLVKRNSLDLANIKFVSSIVGVEFKIEEHLIKNENEEDIKELLPSLMTLPFESSEAEYQYQVLNTEQKGEDIEYKIIATSVSQRDFFKTLDIHMSNKLKVSILDQDMLAVANLYIKTISTMETDTNCIAYIGYDESYVILMQGSAKNLYIRSFDFGYNKLALILAKNRDFSKEEGENMLKNRKFYDFITHSFSKETQETLRETYPVGRFIKQNFLTEMQKTIKYYAKNDFDKMPRKIILTGYAKEFNKLADFVYKNTDIKCSIMDFLVPFSVPDQGLKEKIEKNYVKFCIAAGLSLRYN